jgi:outer membrane protein TolC
VALGLFTQALIVAAPAAFGQETAPKEEVSLSLTDAVDLALKNNLQSVIAREHLAQAKGEKGISLSWLLPNISGAAYQMNQTANLAALGLPMSKLPGISPFTGVFDHFDARIQMTQSVFNLSSILRYRAGSAGVALAREQQRLAVQQVTTATAISYLAVLEADQAVDAAQSNVQLAETLLTLATSQRDAGVANGIDVARAETRLANQHVQLSQAQTNLDTARLDLLRIVNGVGGQPFASSVTLRDQMRLTAEPDRATDEAVKQALTDRVEVSIAEKELKIAETQRKATAADLLPSVSAFGDYGSSGNKLNDVDYPIRVIAATNRDLKAMVEEGKFRSDLYYRLHVFPIEAPPLRDRKSDIPLLLRYFTQKYAQRMNRHIKSIPKAAIEALTRYDWPGNIRELQNLIERSVILTQGPLLQVAMPEVQTSREVMSTRRPALSSSHEREKILLALKEAKGVVGGKDGAAARLGLRRTTLQSRMKKLNIGRDYR